MCSSDLALQTIWLILDSTSDGHACNYQAMSLVPKEGAKDTIQFIIIKPKSHTM